MQNGSHSSLHFILLFLYCNLMSLWVLLIHYTDSHKLSLFLNGDDMQMCRKHCMKSVIAYWANYWGDTTWQMKYKEKSMMGKHVGCYNHKVNWHCMACLGSVESFTAFNGFFLCLIFHFILSILLYNAIIIINRLQLCFEY